MPLPPSILSEPPIVMRQRLGSGSGTSVEPPGTSGTCTRTNARRTRRAASSTGRRVVKLTTLSSSTTAAQSMTFHWCNELSPPAKLQEEATSAEQRRRQRYVDDDEIPAPSAITLNAVANAHAADDYLCSTCCGRRWRTCWSSPSSWTACGSGLLEPAPTRWYKYYPREQGRAVEIPRRDTAFRNARNRGDSEQVRRSIYPPGTPRDVHVPLASVANQPNASTPAVSPVRADTHARPPLPLILAPHRLTRMRFTLRI